MIQPKQTYTHKKGPIVIKILNPSPMHEKHWHVGIVLDQEMVMTCHVYAKDIEENFELTTPPKSETNA